MTILSLDHIQLPMPPDGEAHARAFYGDILGFSEVEKPEPLHSRGGCWFAGPGIGIHLGVVREGFRPDPKAHPAFRVANVEAFRQQLEAAGVSIKPDAAVPHVRRFYAFDPFGNRLEFIQEGDAF